MYVHAKRLFKSKPTLKAYDKKQKNSHKKNWFYEECKLCLHGYFACWGR
jgi:hypothetical protein